MLDYMLLDQLHDYKYTLSGLLINVRRGQIQGNAKILKKQIRAIDKAIKRRLDE